MAFEIAKPTCQNEGYAVSTDGKHLYVKDTTGVYDVDDNPSGWGAPNPEMNQSVVFALAIRKALDGDTLFPGVSSLFVFDPDATNDKQTSFDISFSLDGVIKIVIGRLPVSNDGINTIDTVPVAITDGMYFYYQGDVWKKVSGVNTKVTNYLELVDSVAVVQNSNLDVLYPMLASKQSALYKDYDLEREKLSPDAEDIFTEAWHLYLELVQVSRIFWCNLPVKAQDKLETLITKYQIATQ